MLPIIQATFSYGQVGLDKNRISIDLWDFLLAIYRYTAQFTYCRGEVRCSGKQSISILGALYWDPVQGIWDGVTLFSALDE